MAATVGKVENQPAPGPLEEFARLIDYAASKYVPLEHIDSASIEIHDAVNRAHAAMVINFSDVGLDDRNTHVSVALRIIERMHAHQVARGLLANLDAIERDTP